MILVTGATGNVGGELVRSLASSGEEVRALSRGVARAVLPQGVNGVVGDLDRPETLRGALDGVRAAFLLPGYRDMPRVLAEIRRAGDLVRAPFAGVRVAAIDPFDIAAVAAEGLCSAGHEGRTYTLSGPESLLSADQVRVLGAMLGRDLRLEELSGAEARVEMAKTMPPDYVEAFFSFYADGTLDDSKVYPTVREITGRSPRAFEQWAEARAGALR